MDRDHWQHLLDASQEALERLANAPELDHLERSDRAETIATWLEAHGVATAWDTRADFRQCRIGHRVAGEVDWQAAGRRAMRTRLGWLEARLNLKSLVGQVEQSTGRIAELVKAVKSYSYMDQSPMQEMDIHEGIESTLTMLGHKLKNVTVDPGFRSLRSAHHGLWQRTEPGLDQPHR